MDFHFYGQKGDQYSPSLDATIIAGKVAQGTVVAAECCYGAQLYAPGKAKGQPGISSTYLAGGAYGFFGSSTIRRRQDAEAADLARQRLGGRCWRARASGRHRLGNERKYVRRQRFNP